MRRLFLTILTAGIITTAGFCADSFAGSSAEKLALNAELQAAAPVVVPYPIEDALPLEWEHKHRERKSWSEYEYSVINTYFNLLDEAADMNDFCPNYDKLTYNQKVQAWAQIFVGISHWESGWNPTEVTLEGDGNDEVTHKANESDGLLQVSYGETSDLCPFDYEADKNLPSGSIHRTIFNPYINLYCGIRTMANAIDQNVDQSGVHKIIYNEEWTTLTPTDHIHSKIHSVTAEVHNTLPFCGPPMRGEIFKEDFTRFANLKFCREIVKIWRSSVGKFETYIKYKFKKHGEPPAASPDKESVDPTIAPNIQSPAETPVIQKDLSPDSTN